MAIRRGAKPPLSVTIHPLGEYCPLSLSVGHQSGHQSKEQQQGGRWDIWRQTHVLEHLQEQPHQGTERNA